MAKVGYFEIQVDDFKRSQEFYRKVFGWNFSKIDAPFEYYMVDTGHKGEESINGGMLKRPQPLAKVKKHGGTVTMEKTQLPGIGHIAYGLDSEGNAFGLWEI